MIAPSLNVDPFHGPMVSLPLAIFQFVKSPEPTMIARGFGTAAVLMFVVLTLFVVARVIGAQTVATKERRAERIEAIVGPLRNATLAGYRSVVSFLPRTASLATKRISKDNEK